MKRPKTITNKQAESLKRKMDLRDRLLIALAIESGLRIGDLLNLKVGDVGTTMTIYEKKSKRERTFAISADLNADLKKFVRYKRKASYLFHSARSASKPIHRSTVHRHIKKALKGLKFDASAHSTRKLYAYNKFAETQDIIKVQEALNHKYVTTTLTYLDIDAKKINIMLQGCNK